MNKGIKEKLQFIKNKMQVISYYNNAIGVVGFDFETICPKDAMEDEGNTLAFLDNEIFKIKQDPEVIKAYEFLNEHLDEIEDFYDKQLIKHLHRSYIRNKNITPELNLEITNLYHKSHMDWLNAKENKDYSLFEESLTKVRDAQLKLYNLSEIKYDTAYDFLLADKEPGMTTKDLDNFFNKLKEGTIKILRKIQNSGVDIRDDFLSRKVDIAKQEAFSLYLMKLIGFNTNKGMLGTTEHPFTNTLGQNDARITTHYYEDSFISNIFTIIHEGGHAIFYQNQDPKDYQHFIDNSMTDAMHESVSRFYENRIARSKEFIHLIYPILKQSFKDVLYDVSEEELYKGINKVTPSLIRTEADELTYALHIIIRYELEKDIMNNNLDMHNLNKYWNEKYKEYLGVDVPNDTEGVLQDIHWTEGFAYFPAYALGNAINAMYYNKMKEDIDIKKTVLSGDFTTINNWMKEHVFKKSNYLDPKEWLNDIVGKQLDPQDFLDYLDEKYKDIYNY